MDGRYFGIPHLIGIDIRYAGAGKWKEERFKDNITDVEIDVADVEELKTGRMKLLHIDGRRIILGETEDAFVAFENRCTHKGGSLAAGSMIRGTVQRSWHGSQFDMVSGAVKAGPAKSV